MSLKGAGVSSRGNTSTSTSAKGGGFSALEFEELKKKRDRLQRKATPSDPDGQTLLFENSSEVETNLEALLHRLHKENLPELWPLVFSQLGELRLHRRLETTTLQSRLAQLEVRVSDQEKVCHEEIARATAHHEEELARVKQEHKRQEQGHCGRLATLQDKLAEAETEHKNVLEQQAREFCEKLSELENVFASTMDQRNSDFEATLASQLEIVQQECQDRFDGLLRERLATVGEQHRRSMHALRDENSAALAKLEAEWRHKLDAVSHDGNDLRQELEAKEKRLQRLGEHVAQSKKVMAQLSSALQTCMQEKQELLSQLQSLQQSYEKDLAAVEERYRDEIASLREKKGKELDDISNRVHKTIKKKDDLVKDLEWRLQACHAKLAETQNVLETQRNDLIGSMSK